MKPAGRLLVLVLLLVATPLVSSRRHRYGQLNKARSPPSRYRTAAQMRAARERVIDEDEDEDEEERASANPLDPIEDEVLEGYERSQKDDKGEVRALAAEQQHRHFFCTLLPDTRLACADHCPPIARPHAVAPEVDAARRRWRRHP